MLSCRLFHVRVLQRALKHHIRSSSHRTNPIGLQMLPQKLVDKLFPERDKNPNLDPGVLSAVQKHLEQHNLSKIEPGSVQPVDFEIPELQGATITEHFENISRKYTEPYTAALLNLIESTVPNLPDEFALQAGWVRYSRSGKRFKTVDAPDGNAVVFDVETIVQEGGLPAIAVALSPTHWYSWCSESLVEGKENSTKKITPEILIPMEPGTHKKPRVIIGHNVGFDRGYIREQYAIQNLETRFLDTLSMHVCVSGQTTEQKIMTMSVRKKRAIHEERSKEALKSGKQIGKPSMNIKWMTVSSLNNLADVYELYCGEKLEKSARNTFVTGSSQDVREDFQNLARYCARDVLATRNVLCKLLPMFLERFPHPATMFGMLETLTAYLPINERWNDYLEQSNSTFQTLDTQIQVELNKVATKAWFDMKKRSFRDDPWLWDLDWTPTENAKAKYCASSDPPDDQDKNDGNNYPENYLNTSSVMPKWYQDFCEKKPSKSTPNDWESGPWSSSLQKRAIPKLLKITWKGYPVHYNSQLGWGYLVPENIEGGVLAESISNEAPKLQNQVHQTMKFPLEEYNRVLAATKLENTTDEAVDDANHPQRREIPDFGDFSKMDNDWQEVAKQSNAFVDDVQTVKSRSAKPATYYDIGFEGVWFKKLPQRPGSPHNVGSPLSRSMIEKYWGTKLSSYDLKGNAELFKMVRKISYWKTMRDKITEQVAVLNLPTQGAILPRIMPAGNLNRNPMDRVWSTSSRANQNCVGAEFKAMIQAPKNYHLVSFESKDLELWIAALLSDAEFARTHGCTALAFKVLEGPENPEVDLHNHTARILKVERDQARIIDLVRLHGGSQKLICKILADWETSMRYDEIWERTKKLLKLTKGQRRWPATTQDTIDEIAINANRRAILLPSGKQVTQVKAWADGSESHVHNRIERIVSQSPPSLPFLNGKISRPLDSRFCFNYYKLSRVNWVLQSSAVDFQHLMLLSVRHFFDELGIKGRLVLPTQDKISFMVCSRHRYKAALAMHLSNLFVRAFCAERVGMSDLPYSVAFCSNVTIDSVLRDDVWDNLVTPSNPEGMFEKYGIHPGVSLDIKQTLELVQL